ncbi:MAG TPA: cysteine hydrolase family protein [Caulobacteraceae bacterium]|jgi:nicotinamidase-related amidase
MPKTALLIIDVQNAVVAGAWRLDETLAVIADLAARARTAGTPVLYLQHTDPAEAALNHGAEGWAIHPAVTPAPGEPVIEKTASDGFYATSLKAELDRRDISRLVICGAQTEFCVDATTRASLSAGYDVTLVADGHTTGDGVLHAQNTIAHHNQALGWLAHPDHKVEVKNGAEIEFPVS